MTVAELRTALTAAIQAHGTRPVLEAFLASIQDCLAQAQIDDPKDQDRIVRLNLNRDAIQIMLTRWY